MADTFDTIIHLVSDQTMQNVLPILALRPRRVIQVHSPSPAFVRKAQHTRDAVALAQRTVPKLGNDAPAIEWEEVALHEPFPGLAETAAVIRPFLARAELGRICVNYTGGTKNMSIGAWKAASEEGVATLYCDTPRAFLGGGTAPLDIPIGLMQVAALLNTPIVLSSHGLNQVHDWISSQIPASGLKIGQIGYDLLRRFGPEFIDYRSQLESMAKSARAPYVVPAPGNPEFEEYLRAAQRRRLMEIRDGQLIYSFDTGAVRQSVKERLHEISKELVGGAFEGYVASLLSNSRKYSHFLSNVKLTTVPGRSDGQGGESDLVAYSPKSIGLTLISCKCSYVRLEHLEATVTRKARLGGLYAGALICVERASSFEAARIRRWCDILRMNCAFGFVDNSEQDEIPEALGVERDTATR